MPMNAFNCQSVHQLLQIMETLLVHQMNNGPNVVHVKEAVIILAQCAHFSADLLDATVTDGTT